MSGFMSRVSISSRQITSEAIADPPGLSMRTTIARTVESTRTLRSQSTKVSEPTTPPEPSSALLPDAIVPDGVQHRDPRSPTVVASPPTKTLA